MLAVQVVAIAAAPAEFAVDHLIGQPAVPVELLAVIVADFVVP
ncbi:hypothetical protein GCM10009001_16400 [Virgibacillus siamensis]|uniref:Uncharacterized protein n=1 Tax=Virgibacillus siamensis TaxID=480071 RepID=A0ABN1FYV9_9BACI